MRHLGALAVGLAGLAVVAAVPTELWYRLNWLLVVAGLGSLVLVLLPMFGVAENGSRRWLLLGPITVQASEPARLFLLLYLAGYAVRRSTQLGESLNGLVKPSPSSASPPCCSCSSPTSARPSCSARPR